MSEKQEKRPLSAAEINHVAELTKRVESLFGKAGVNDKSMTEAQLSVLLEVTHDVVRAAQADYATDLLIQKVGAELGKDVAKHVNKTIARDVANHTMLAYKDWRWYADRLAGGAIATVGAVTILGGAKLVMDRFKKRPDVETENPFNAGDNVASFKATPRPAARGKEQPNLQNLM